MKGQPVKTLTIGGSDSGGAAGIQADLKTWTVLGVYGMSVISAVTAQNSLSVEAIQYIPPQMVAAQIDAVLSDYGTDALKTGFLGRVDLVHTVAQRLKFHDASPLVVDPVLVNHKGDSMFPVDVAKAYGTHLLPLAELITPNWREAALLAGIEVNEKPDSEILQRIARQLHDLGAKHILITGVSLTNDSVDYWYDGTHLLSFPQPRIKTDNRHGSGDTLSAAICAFLARGADTAGAITKAQKFTARALSQSATWKLGRGHGPLSLFSDPNTQP